MRRKCHPQDSPRAPTAEKISVSRSSKWPRHSWRPDLGKSRGSRGSNNQGMGTITCVSFDFAMWALAH